MIKGGRLNPDKINEQISYKQEQINDIDTEIAKINRNSMLYLSTDDKKLIQQLNFNKRVLKLDIEELEMRLSKLPSYEGGKKTIKRKKSRKSRKSKTSKKYFS